MVSLRGLAKNVALRTGTEAFKKTVNLAFVIIVARKLGADGLGRYSFMLVLTMILGLVADCGFSTLMLREVATRRDEARKLLGASIIIKLLLSGLVLGLLWGVLRGLTVASQINGSPHYCSGYLFAAYCIFLSFMEMFNAFFVVDQRLDLDALTNVVQRGGSVLLGTVFIYLGMDVMGIGLAFAVATCVSAVLAFVVVSRRFGPPIFYLDWSLSLSLLKEAIPLALMLFFSNVYFKIDQLMLGWIRSDTELGWYSAAYRIFEVAALVPSILMLIALPLFSRLQKDSKEKLVPAGEQILAMLCTSAIAVAVLITLGAPSIITLFGRDFGADSSLALTVLIWTAVPIFCNFVLTTVLIAIGKQINLVYGFTFGAAVNIVLNLLMIPRWGYLGAAVSTVFTELLLLVLVSIFVRRYVPGWRTGKVLWRPALCGVVSVAVLHIVRLWGYPVLAAALWAVVFAVGVLVLRTIDLGQLALLRGSAEAAEDSQLSSLGDRC